MDEHILQREPTKCWSQNTLSNGALHTHPDGPDASAIHVFAPMFTAERTPAMDITKLHGDLVCARKIYSTEILYHLRDYRPAHLRVLTLWSWSPGGLSVSSKRISNAHSAKCNCASVCRHQTCPQKKHPVIPEDVTSGWLSISHYRLRYKALVGHELMLPVSHPMRREFPCICLF